MTDRQGAPTIIVNVHLTAECPHCGYQIGLSAATLGSAQRHIVAAMHEHVEMNHDEFYENDEQVDAIVEAYRNGAPGMTSGGLRARYGRRKP